MNVPKNMPYAALRCKCTEGPVIISHENYTYQMGKPDNRWQCPKCGEVCWFDDDVYESLMSFYYEGDTAFDDEETEDHHYDDIDERNDNEEDGS